jgi:hypothetical protein
MYTIIGGDGKEYGPVSAEQVRSWISGGRANRQTRIRAEGTLEWKTVGEFPELDAPPPMGTSALGAAALSDAPRGKLEVIRCYERSWELLKANFWAFVGVAVLMCAIYAATAYLQQRGILFLSVIINAPLGGGLGYYFIRKIRGQPAGVGEVFAGFKRPFVTLVMLGIVTLILVAAGMLCLIVPGIYLAVAWSFAHLYAIDKGGGFWAAMESCRRGVTGNWWRLLGLFLLGIPFLILGIAALGIGIFVALPLVWAAGFYAYEDLFGRRG